MGVLFERDAQLARLAGALSAAAGGRGRVVTVEGPAGMGKSALLAQTIRIAPDHGLRPLAARGSELGRELAFGLVRELLAGAVAEGDLTGAAVHAGRVLFDDRSVPDRADRAARIAALWSVVQTLAAGTPLLLAVDDAQWSDDPSLDFLHHVAARIAGAPVLLVIAARPDARAPLPPHADTIALPPLGEDGVAELAAGVLGKGPDPRFVAACRRAAGGNPFLTGELLRELRRDGVAPEAEAIPRVETAGPETIARAVVGRLARERPAAVALARAVAVLGPGAALRHAAGVTGLGLDEAAIAADALIRADVLADRRPLEFVHPIVGGSVDGDMTSAERAALHGRAARVLAADDTPADRVAAHLLEAEPASDPWAVDRLLIAADQARGRGAPDVAAHYLRRALDEPAGERAPEVELALGRAEALAGEPGGGLEHLRRALERRAPGPEQAELSIEVAQACVPLGRFEEAVTTLAAAIDGLGPEDRELALRAEALRASAGRLHPATSAEASDRLERVAADLAGDGPGGRMVTATLAFQRLLAGAPADEAAGLARHAFDGGLLAEQTADSSPVFDALFVLVTCAPADEARRACDAVLADARARGTMMGVGVSLNQRSLLRLRAGDVTAAESDARAALEAAESGRHVRATGSVCHLAEALLERGAAGEALALLAARGLDGPLPEHFLGTLLLYVRGRLHVAAGAVDAGIADLQTLAGREHHARSPAVVPWRSALAVALVHGGDTRAAVPIAREGFDAARAVGSRWAEAVALHALGLAEGSEERLRRAAAVAEAAGARLERARALIDLGALIRRSGRAADARVPLREGGELAHALGAAGLARRARDELAATGVRRVNRLLLSGVEGLTPSELRVARLAAEGLTNRAIAQALFVTPKTVEVHLGNAYRKLGIRSRSELAGAGLDLGG